MGAPWWRNHKLGPLDNVMGNYRSSFWWHDEEIGGPWWRIGNFGPFDDAMGKLERGNCGGRPVNDLMGKTGIVPMVEQWNIWGPFGDAMGKLETLAMGKLGPPDDLMGKLRALDHKLFSNCLIRLHCTLSNLRAPNFNWEILDDMQAEKNTWGPYSNFSSYISKIVWWLPMFDFGIFCHLLRLMGIYRVGGPRPAGYLKGFVPSILFFLSSFLFFSFLSLSRGPL